MRTTFLTTDNILFIIFTKGGDGTSPVNHIYVDLNASKEPNIVGKDLFVFTRTDKGIVPYCYLETANTIKQNCSKNSDGFCCSARLALDGWEIKDNYPW